MTTRTIRDERQVQAGLLLALHFGADHSDPVQRFFRRNRHRTAPDAATLLTLQIG